MKKDPGVEEFVFTCKRKVLLEGAGTVAKAVSGKTNLPILSHILIQTMGDGSVKLSANDLEVGIEVVVEAEVKKAGASTVPARPFIEVLSGLRGDEVTMAMIDKGRVKIKSESSDYKLFGLPAEEFHELVSVDTSAKFNVAGRDLKRGLKRTLFCLSTDESRASMTGVLFQGKDGRTELVSTDTHRLSVVRLSVSENSGEMYAIIPGRALVEVMRLAPDSEEEQVEVYIDGKSARFVFGTTVIASRIIDGRFPNFSNVVPQSFVRTIELPTVQLMQSVRRAEIVAREAGNIVICETGEGVLIITAESASIGAAYEEVDMALIGEPVKMGYNGKYFLEMLLALDAEITVIEANSAIEPVKVTDGTDETFLHILMPVQLQG